MKLYVKKQNGLKAPEKANPDDACYDIIAASEPIIKGKKLEMPLDGINAWSKIDWIEYKTNLFVAPQDIVEYNFRAARPEENLDVKMVQEEASRIQYHIQGFARSSIRKKNLVLANSVATLDHGYRGEITFCFKYIFQPEDFIIVPEFGMNKIYATINPDNIYQMGDAIVQWKAEANIPIEYVFVDELNNTQRGTGGYGSSS